MFARSSTLRASSLLAAIVLTVAMLGAIEGLAVTQHAEPAVAAASADLAHQPG